MRKIYTLPHYSSHFCEKRVIYNRPSEGYNSHDAEPTTAEPIDKKQFDQYRKRIRERLGVDKPRNPYPPLPGLNPQPVEEVGLTPQEAGEILNIIFTAISNTSKK